MALQGTIDTFPLTDVLTLLASSKKSGRLVLDGDRGRASLWITDGEVVGGEVLGAGEGATAASLLFELLRFTEASFAFDVAPPGTEPDVAVVATSIETGLREASALLSEWDDIVAVVPSLAHRVVLVPELPEESVTLDPTSWSLVLAAASDPVVAAVGDALGFDEFGACAAVASLVEQGLATIAEPAAFEPAGTIAIPEPVDALAAVESDAAAVEIDEPEAAAAIDLADTLSAASEERVEREFPDRFPIDDLLGGDGHPADDVWSSPEMEQLEAQRRAAASAEDAVAFDGLPPLEPVPFESPAPATTGPDAWDELLPDLGPDDADDLADEAAEAPTDAAADDSTDEVLRQMSKLSPQAAEAIAAALNSVPAAATPPSAPEERASAADDDADGPVSFSGMF